MTISEYIANKLFDEGIRFVFGIPGGSSMGFGIPAAMAAQLNYRESAVVCVTGDGGFQMMAGEMITLKRYNLPVIVGVFSDG